MGELLKHYDFFNPDHVRRSEEFAAHAREHCPVVHSSVRGGQHIVTRYEDVRRVLEDSATFSSLPAASIVGTQGITMPPIDTDPPLQREYRKLLNPYFHPRRIAEYEDTVRAVARAAIASWKNTGACEVIGDFAGPFVTDVLARVVFGETDETVFRIANDFVLRISHGESEAFPEFRQFLINFVNRRRDDPEPSDDVVRAINTATIDSAPLTDDERAGVVLVLFLGGLDTTKVALGNIIHQMTLDPGLESRLRVPGWERHVLDEMLRYQAPVTALGRVATKDVSVAGQLIEAGERVVVHFASANRDERVFEHADELVFDRARNPHVAFGLGVHRCIGLHLARLQLRVGLEEFLAVATDLHLAPGTRLIRHPSVAAVFESLPITFTPVGSEGS